MKILHLTPYVPSVKASHAGGVCMGKQAEWLARNHEYHLLTFVNSEEDKHLLETVAGDVNSVGSSKISMALRAICHPRVPLLFSVRSSVSFAIKLIRLVKRYEIEAIHAEYTSMGQYVWIKRLFPHIVYSLIEHDVTQQSYARKVEDATGLSAWIDSRQLQKVKRAEAKYINKVDVVYTFSKKDCQLIDSLYTPKVNAVQLAPYYGVESGRATKEGQLNPVICFIGQMGRAENDEAAIRLISIFREYRLNEVATLRIIGANPSARLLDEAGDDVEVTGFVDDINGCIQECAVAAFPLMHGAGIKLKVLLAASLGLPVVTTGIGSEGIDDEGAVLIVEDDDAAFAQEIRLLLENKSYYQRKRSEIKSFIDGNFSWDISERELSLRYPVSG